MRDEIETIFRLEPAAIGRSCKHVAYRCTYVKRSFVKGLNEPLSQVYELSCDTSGQAASDQFCECMHSSLQTNKMPSLHKYTR